MSVKIQLFFAISSSIILWGGCDNDKQNQKIDEAAMARSASIYQTNCASCHGEQMIAFTDRTWKHGQERDSLIQTISNGVLDAGMPAWGKVLSEVQIQELADYIITGIEHVKNFGFEEVRLESDTFQTEKFAFHLDTVASGLSIPWGIAFLPNAEILVTEKKGDLILIKANGEKVLVSGTPKVSFDVQGGLLDILLHPDFANNNWLYLSYSDYIIEKGDTLSGTAIDRFTYKNGTLTEPLEIFRGRPYSSAKWHYGSRMVFDDKKHLFFIASDRANQKENPQTLENPKGKIHRVYEDGSIPEDNPFVNTESAVPSIYSYGHRNAQGLAYHAETGVLWAHEHGPRGGDELNIIKKGANYGWPNISYGINYDGTSFTQKVAEEGMEQPVHYWTPSIAPCGMAFVNSAIYPGWNGDLLVGSLRFKYLNRCILKDGKVIQEEVLMKNIGRLRDVRQGPDGYIYISVEEPGFIFRLIPL
ncbi:MAG: PQQ-dependent sugar dehydrogenase [Saprospiraceae bacterium]|nr:PQQ-dependent sugar dehydrogenase [Saprospiraceae bacterium]